MRHILFILQAAQQKPNRLHYRQVTVEVLLKHLLELHLSLLDISKLGANFLCLFTAQHIPDKLDDFIDTINSKLQPMFMQIRKGMSEDSGHQYYALVSGKFIMVFQMLLQYLTS